MKKGQKLVLDGKEFYLRYTVNSMRKLEKQHGLKISELSNELDLDMVLTLLCVGINDPEVDADTLGDMIDMENIKEVIEVLTKSLGGLPQQKI